MKKKLIVLGSTGFIGRNVAEYFASQSDFDVYGTYYKSDPLPLSNIHMLHANLTNQEDVNRVLNGMDVIVQAAAVTSGSKDVVNSPHIHIADNAVMNTLIFRSAFDYFISHILFLSCSIMYHSSEKPLKESDFDPSQEINPNYFGAGWNKVYLEKMCEFYSRMGRNKYTVLRHSNIYGPYDKYDLEKSHVFGATVAKVMNAKEGKVTVWGSGEEERDLLYVSDIVNFIEQAILKQKSHFEIFNAGYGQSISVKNLVHKIVTCSGNKLDIEYDLSKPSIKTKLCLDSTKAMNSLGWKPQISLDEGIQKTLDWYQKNYK